MGTITQLLAVLSLLSYLRFEITPIDDRARMAIKCNSGKRTTFRLEKFRKRQQRKRLARLRSRNSLFEPLEPRQMLTVAADPVQPLPTGAGPLEVKLGPVDAGQRDDLVALSADGHLTVALNQDDNRWQSIQTTNLGLGPLNSMELTLIDANPFSDVVVGHSSGTVGWQKCRTLVGIRCLRRRRFVALRHLSRAAHRTTAFP